MSDIMRDCVDVRQVAYVSNDYSEIGELFCYLAISAIAHELKNLGRPFDAYTIANDDGHVSYHVTSS